MYRNFTDAQRIDRLSQKLLIVTAHAEILAQLWRACHQAVEEQDWHSLRIYLAEGDQLFQAMLLES